MGGFAPSINIDDKVVDNARERAEAMLGTEINPTFADRYLRGIVAGESVEAATRAGAEAALATDGASAPNLPRAGVALALAQPQGLPWKWILAGGAALGAAALYWRRR